MRSGDMTSIIFKAELSYCDISTILYVTNLLGKQAVVRLDRVLLPQNTGEKSKKNHHLVKNQRMSSKRFMERKNISTTLMENFTPFL